MKSGLSVTVPPTHRPSHGRLGRSTHRPCDRPDHPPTVNWPTNYPPAAASCSNYTHPSLSHYTSLHNTSYFSTHISPIFGHCMVNVCQIPGHLLTTQKMRAATLADQRYDNRLPPHLRKSSFMFKLCCFCKTKVEMLKFAALIAKCLMNNL